MVGAVLVHDREPLDALGLTAGFRNIDDTAVEISAFAGQTRIDRIGAFVRGAAPEGGLGREALSRQNLFREDIVEVATHCDRPVAVHLHEAGDKRLRRHRAPVREARASTSA